MEVNEQQVYEALGVEQPAQEQTPQETQQPQAQPPQGEMSLEQRRENAARRRRAETRAAIQEAVEAERDRVDAALPWWKRLAFRWLFALR